MDDWKPHAARLAETITHPTSRWRAPVAATPRHRLVPTWWRHLAPHGWTLRTGQADRQRWLRAAYSDRTLVTRVGTAHADLADAETHPTGRPTSSATDPRLVVRMLQHTLIDDHMDVLDVGTGSGYSAALLAHRLGPEHVTSLDVDPYLTQAAAKRLDQPAPRFVTTDATGPLPGVYDRIVSTVNMPYVPASWLHALRPGGRLVTVIAGTTLILTADKNTHDDGATGRIEWDRAGFMPTRTGPDFPPDPGTTEAFERDGEHVTTGRYPVIHVAEAWEIASALALTAPGIQHGYREDADGRHTAVMAHDDGSWARATGHRGQPPTVHQGGPRRLWDLLDQIRHDWLTDGYLQLYGARARIEPDGTCHLTRGTWHATIPQPPTT